MIKITGGSHGLAMFLFVFGILQCSRECEAIPNLGKAPDQILRDYDTRFGDAIALHGGTALIGASEKGGKGSFYVYNEIPDAAQPWQLEQTMNFDPDFPGYAGADSSSFGSAVGLNLDVAIVGAPYLIPEDSADPYGAAFLFRRDVNGAFQLIADLKSTLADSVRGGFGHDVAIGRNHIVVSELDAGIENSYYSVGAVHVYSYSRVGEQGLGFLHLQTIYPPEPHMMTHFGSSIDLAGETLVVGEEGRTVNGVQWVGRAYTYVWNGSTSSFDLSNTLMPEFDLTGQFFGSAVAISADESTVVVGAKGDYQSENHIGKAFSFDMSFLVPRRFNLVPVVGTITTADRFGAAVAVSSDGTYVVVGSPGLQKDGAIYAFSNVGANIAAVRGLHDFGHAMAMSDDDHFLMVADLAGENVSENIYIWRNESPRPPRTPLPTPVATPSPTGAATPTPTVSPTVEESTFPSSSPTSSPTSSPSGSPTGFPTVTPTIEESSSPSQSPTPEEATLAPTSVPTPASTTTPVPTSVEASTAPPSASTAPPSVSPVPTPQSEPVLNPIPIPSADTLAPSLRPGFNGVFSERSSSTTKLLSPLCLGLFSVGFLVLFA